MIANKLGGEKNGKKNSRQWQPPQCTNPAPILAQNLVTLKTMESKYLPGLMIQALTYMSVKFVARRITWHWIVSIAIITNIKGDIHPNSWQ